ncbi:MAG: hypothetical protein ACTSQH_03710 [Candidatus Hodarchaeales archaeon]
MTLDNPQTGPGNLKKFVITSNNSGDQVDLANGVVEYRYYENVLSNYITSSAIVVESGEKLDGAAPSTLDSLPIRGGEKTDIIIEDVVGNEIKIDEGMYVNRVKNGAPGTEKDLYQLDFVSKEYFLNEQSRVVKRYEGNISTNVGVILADVLKTEELIDIDETQNSYNFLGNTRSPFYTCTWLASKSIPSSSGETSGPGGFLFFQTRDGLCFKSIDKLFGKDPIKKFLFNNTGKLVAGYDANILSYSIDSDIDMNRNMTMGAYNNVTTYFDYSGMINKYTKFNIDVARDSVTTAGRDYINVNKNFIKAPSRYFTYIKDIGVNPDGKGNEQLDSWKNDKTKQNFDAEQVLVQSIMRYNQLFTVVTNIIIAGDFSIRAGDIVECDFPQLEAQLNKETNPQSGGKYMVASVCHRMTPRETYTSLGLVRDSFGKTTGFGGTN